jgi:hypothetical protein
VFGSGTAAKAEHGSKTLVRQWFWSVFLPPLLVRSRISDIEPFLADYSDSQTTRSLAVLGSQLGQKRAEARLAGATSIHVP